MSLASKFTRSVDASARKAAIRLSSFNAVMILALSTPDLSAVSTFVTHTFKDLQMEVSAMIERQAAPATEYIFLGSASARLSIGSLKVVESSKGRDTCLARHCKAVPTPGGVSQKSSLVAVNGYSLVKRFWVFVLFLGFSHSSSKNSRISIINGNVAPCFFRFGKYLFIFSGD